MKIGRRRVLQTTAAVLTGSLLLPEMTKRSETTLTLVDETLSQRELGAAGAWPMAAAAAIQSDLVRQWRDGLGAQVANAEAVTAYVRWDKALVLVGLARESRMGYRSVQVGRSVFAVRVFRRG